MKKILSLLLCAVMVLSLFACSKEKSEKAPALYDLTTLQRDANRILGYTAQQTLNIVQTLYEKSKNKLYYLAFDILQDENAAEDAVCSCFIRLLEIYDLYSYTSYQQLERLAALLVRHLAYSMPEAQINSQDLKRFRLKRLNLQTE